MPDLDEMTPGQILADTNVATFIAEMGLGIARAQQALDQNSLATAVEMATTRPEFSNRSLLDLGFSPTFYHYQHADLDVSLQITLRVERSTTVNVGLTGSFSNSNASSTEGTGEARITVNFGGGAPARATVRLAEAAAGTLVVGATTVALQAGAATSPNVGIVANSLSRTARALADRMSNPPDAVPEVLQALVELVPGGTAITATSTSPAFDVSQPNRIVVNDVADQPARAWLSITGAGNVQLIGTDAATWATTPTAVDAAQAAIDALSPYDASVLFRAGTSVPSVTFAHNKEDVFEPATSVLALDPLIEFLKRNSGLTVRVVGHTDTSGSESRNNPLSLARANHIRSHLLLQGIPAAQIVEAVGRGETQPLPGTGGNGLEVLANRRVQLELVGEIANVVLVQTVTRGATAVWESGRPAVPAGGRLLAALNGSNGVAIANGAIVGLSGQEFVVGTSDASAGTRHTWVPGATADGAARALASSIFTNGRIDAFAEGRVVRLLPVGSHALLRLESQARNAAANNLTLTATGSLSREAPFSGATEGGEPAAGDTVTIAATVLTVTTGASPGTREFAKGTDAASTATNLATAVSAISGMRGTASGAVVTVTGLSGTRLATSNTGAFVLSAATISGTRPTPERTERNTTVAAGLSVDVGVSRRFGLETTGNSRIQARLVSLPAPVQLLDEIRTFLGPNPLLPPAPAPSPTPAPAPSP